MGIRSEMKTVRGYSSFTLFFKMKSITLLPCVNAISLGNLCYTIALWHVMTEPGEAVTSRREEPEFVDPADKPSIHQLLHKLI